MNRTFDIISTDGLTLRGRCWPTEKSCEAVICLVHGQGEHLGRYDHVAAAFNQAGINLLGTDLRGHGNSGGKRGHVPTFGILLDDLFQTLEKARAAFPSKPLFLYGHSLGGLIVLDYVLKRNTKLNGIIVSAPLLQLASAPPAWKLCILELCNRLRLNPSIPNGVDDQLLSHDINVARIYRNDPLTHHHITPSLASGMFEAGQWCMDHASELSLPALFIHGAADKITSPAATQTFVSNISADCTLEILPGLFHEPHNETEKTAVFKLLTDWILRTAL